MIEKHQTEMVDNFKRFLDEHGHKLVVALNDEGTHYDAFVPGLICEYATWEGGTEFGEVTLSNVYGNYVSTPEEAMFRLALGCRGKNLIDKSAGEEYEVPDCFPDLSSYSESGQLWGVV